MVEREEVSVYLAIGVRGFEDEGLVDDLPSKMRISMLFYGWSGSRE